MNSLNTILNDLGACDAAVEFSKDKTLQEAWETCPRGDWMLWLFRRAPNFDKRASTLAKGHCANTVRHLMTDLRSTAAVDAAIAYGNREIDDQQLKDAYAAAYAAAAATADAAAAYAAAAAAADAAADAAAAATAAATADAAAAATAARTKNQKETADICRKYLPLPQFN
jgi:hypothetical protein